MDDKWKMFFLLGILVMVTIWLAVLLYPKKEFKVVACDVGQGDAVLITYGSTQILSDGGPDSSVLDCLSDNIAFWDRNIELVLISHPQLDHFGGVIDIVERFNVGTIITTGLFSGSQEWEVLESLVGGSASKVVNVDSGQNYRLGLIHLDILWPTKTYISANSAEINDGSSSVLGAYSSSEDPNDFSLVSLVSFKDFDILLTGDISPEVSDILAEKMLKDTQYKDIEVLKVPHHGSKNGLTEKLLKVVDPDTAIISVGVNNHYGHPSKEIIELLDEYKVKVHRTDMDRDVEIIYNPDNDH